MKTVILAGGLGTRLREETIVKPKPMVEIGGRPILWHIMNIYASQGYKEFIIALGYKGEVIKDYFLNYYHRGSDISVHLSSESVVVRQASQDDWLVHLVDTGLHTAIGGRIKRLVSYVGNETFMVTYGDGVADIDIQELVEFHGSQGKLATVTAVRPPARFGSLDLNGDLVTTFAEKSQAGAGWINGGFFVLEPGVLDYIQGDDTSFERVSLEHLAGIGQLAAYRHEGFWQCMDTMRDVELLELLWNKGDAPWRVWDD